MGLGDQRVLLIGDSSMQQTYATLKNAFYGTNCFSQFSYGECNSLNGKLLGQRNRGGTWQREIERFVEHDKTRTAPEIVVLTVGAHVISEEAYDDVINTLFDEIGNETLRRQMYPNTTFVWKTQQPAGCNKKESYSPVLHSPEDLFLESEVLYTHEYHRYMYQRDVYTISRIQTMNRQHREHHQQDTSGKAFPPPLLRLLDMRMLYSRIDSHTTMKQGDCLHYCTPGPLDIIAPLFQQMLERMEEEKSKESMNNKGTNVTKGVSLGR